MPFFRRKPKLSEPDTQDVKNDSSSQRQAPPVAAELTESLSNRLAKPREPYQAHPDSGYVSVNTSPTPSEHDDSHSYSRRTKPAKPDQLLTALPQIPVSSVSAPDLGSNSLPQHGKQPSIQLHAPAVDIPVDSPSSSRLQGFKVNKRGTVLDEEGELIGELIAGDLLDCVRQPVNSRGEVLDDQGNVVGKVRTIPKGQSAVSMLVHPPLISDAHLVRTSSEHVHEHVHAKSEAKGDWTPNMFAYRGDIPHREAPSRSTSHLSFTGLSPAQGMARPSMNSRHTFSVSTSRSPYASMGDSAPCGAEDGGPAFPRPGGYTYKSDFTQAMISGPPSRASSTYRQHRPMSQSPSTFATTATINRPRTYFTHQGKITVQPGEDFPKPAPKEPEAKSDVPTPTAEKRRSKLFGMGRKK